MVGFSKLPEPAEIETVSRFLHTFVEDAGGRIHVGRKPSEYDDLSAARGLPRRRFGDLGDVAAGNRPPDH